MDYEDDDDDDDDVITSSYHDYNYLDKDGSFNMPTPARGKQQHAPIILVYAVSGISTLLLKISFVQPILIVLSQQYAAAQQLDDLY